MKKIKKCFYYSAKDQLEWAIEYDKDKSLITKNIKKMNIFFSHSEKKRFEKEVMTNLEAFFNSGFEQWNQISSDKIIKDKDSDTIIVTVDNTIYQISSEQLCDETEKNLFQDLNRYFNCYWENNIKPISLSYHSFDGGGPEYSMEVEQKGIFTWYSTRIYYKKNHEELCGAGYNVNYILYPLRIGTSTAILEGFSPICRQPTRKIFVEVDENFNMSYHIEEIEKSVMR